MIGMTRLGYFVLVLQSDWLKKKQLKISRQRRKGSGGKG